MAKINPATSDELVGQYIMHLTRRINLLKARLEGQGFTALQQMPQLSYVSLMTAPEQTASAEVKKKFGSLYIFYLIWRQDTDEINKEILGVVNK